MVADDTRFRKLVMLSVGFVVAAFLISAFASVILDSEWDKVNLSRASSDSRSVAMTLDEDGHANVAYLAIDFKEDSASFDTDLTYAHINGNSVSRVKLADLETDECEMAIVADGSGGVHVFAGLFNDESIVHADNLAGDWETSTIPLEGYCSSLKAAIDPQGNLQLLYVEWVGYQDSLGNDFFKQCLRLLTLSPTGNHTTTITETEVNGGWLTVTAFRFDSQGYMHFLYTYMNYSGPSGGSLFYTWLYYVTNKDGTWSNQTFVSGSTLTIGRPSLTLDSQDGVYICYYNPSGDELETTYAHKTGDNWAYDVIGAAGNTGTVTSIALDQQGGLHMLYYIGQYEQENYYTGDLDCTLMYAVLQDGTVDLTTIERDQWGFYISADVAVDADGHVHMLYHSSVIIQPSQSNPEGGSSSYTRYASRGGGSALSDDSLRNAAVITACSCVAAFVIVMVYASRKNSVT